MEEILKSVDKMGPEMGLNRNGQLASLEAALAQLRLSEESGLLGPCQKYLSLFKIKPFCFEDLKPYIEKLSREQQVDFWRFCQEHITAALKTTSDKPLGELPEVYIILALESLECRPGARMLYPDHIKFPT